MKRISLISALVLLGGSFLLAPVAKADQDLNMEFTGVAQANCLFTNIQSGTIIAKGRDLGTIGSTDITVTPLGGGGGVSGVVASPAKFTSTCNSGTAFFVDTPVADAANSPLTLISTKSVLSNITVPATPTTVVAYTASPGTGLAGTSVRSDGFINAETVGTAVPWTVDMNAQVKSTIPVGVYKYTVLVTAVPL